jgi:hypothetical protein
VPWLQIQIQEEILCLKSGQKMVEAQGRSHHHTHKYFTMHKTAFVFLAAFWQGRAGLKCVSRMLPQDCMTSAQPSINLIACDDCLVQAHGSIKQKQRSEWLALVIQYW